MPRSTSPRNPTLHHSHSNSHSQSHSHPPTTPIRHPTFDSLTSATTTVSSPFEHVSPTKALALSRLQHDIAQLTLWLDSLFVPSPVPGVFLRWRDEAISRAGDGGGGRLIGEGGGGDNEVLEALKTLKQVNLAAEYLRGLVVQAEREELGVLGERGVEREQQRGDRSVARELVSDVVEGLSSEGTEALESLSRGAVTLGMRFIGDDEGSVAELFRRKIIKQAHRNFVLQQQVRDLEILEQTIQAESVTDQGGLTVDDKLHDEESEKLRAQTARYIRDTKQINLKIMEYEDRVKGLERQVLSLRGNLLSMQDVLEAHQRVAERKVRVQQLQERIAIFHDLPPDLEKSRSEVRRAMNELDALNRKRDELSERLSNG